MLRDPYSLLPAFGPVPEESSVLVTGILADETGAPLTTLDSLTATLFDRVTIRILNGRHEQSILNTNGGAFDPTTGRVTLLLTPADSIVVDQRSWTEEHILRLDFAFTPAGGPQRTGRYAMVLRVQNLEQLSEAR